MSNSVNNRYDFVLLFDVRDGNPNGDPDAGNLPRIDPETAHGLVTDVCLKRKVRNYVQLSKGNAVGYDIFIKEKAILNTLIDQAHEQEDVKAKEKIDDKIDAARQYMCKTYYDVRTFGAVMSTRKNAGQVRGPVQMTFSRSIDQVVPLEHCITRMAVTTEEDAKKQQGDNRTMGRKYTIPYALYRCHGFVSAALAEQTGFSEKDLSLFWESLKNMFEHDRSASRGEMTARKLVVFQHDSKYGNAPAHQLFERLRVERQDNPKPTRAYSDYKVTIDKDGLPPGVKVIEML
jgi:CRISPR-associated protein Csd2